MFAAGEQNIEFFDCKVYFAIGIHFTIGIKAMHSAAEIANDGMTLVSESKIENSDFEIIIHLFYTQKTYIICRPIVKIIAVIFMTLLMFALFGAGIFITLFIVIADRRTDIPGSMYSVIWWLTLLTIIPYFGLVRSLNDIPIRSKANIYNRIMTHTIAMPIAWLLWYHAVNDFVVLLLGASAIHITVYYIVHLCNIVAVWTGLVTYSDIAKYDVAPTSYLFSITMRKKWSKTETKCYTRQNAIYIDHKRGERATP